MKDPKSRQPQKDTTLSKGLTILEALAYAPGSMGVTALSKNLGLTKSNTFRLLQTLVALGYVRHLPDKTYAASLKTWQVGRAQVETLNLRKLAAPELITLFQATGETVYLAVPDGLTAVYIHKIETAKPARTWNGVGNTVPLHAPATGKAILAANYKTLRDQMRGRLTKYTDRTLTTLDALDADVRATRARGFAYDSGELRPHVLSFGAAITLPEGEAVGALGISLPDISLPLGGMETYGAWVADAAAAVSRKLWQS